MTAASQPTLGAALAAAQSEFPPIGRSKTVKVTTKTGGSYTFSYAPLEAIIEATRPVLAKHGLAVSQPLTEHEGRPALESILLHSSGERLTAKFPLANVPASPQELGSLLTYLRRYAYTALLGIATEEDDDGNHASGNQASAASAAGRAAPSANPAPAGPPEPPFKAPDGAADGKVITEAQLRKLWASWREVGAPDEILKRLVENVAGVDSTKKIPKDRFNQLLEAVAAEKQRLATVGGSDDDIPFEPTV